MSKPDRSAVRALYQVPGVTVGMDVDLDAGGAVANGAVHFIISLLSSYNSRILSSINNCKGLFVEKTLQNNSLQYSEWSENKSAFESNELSEKIKYYNELIIVHICDVF